MSLLEVLMLYRDTFRYDDFTIENPKTVKLGEIDQIDRLKIPEKRRGKESGYVYSMAITLDAKDTTIKITYKYKDAEYPVIGDAMGLVDVGLVQPNPTGLWVSKYDETNDLYTIMYTPWRGLPFWDEIKVEVIPQSKDTTVYWYSRLFLIFNLEKIDEIMFRWSGGIRALAGGEL